MFDDVLKRRGLKPTKGDPKTGQSEPPTTPQRPSSPPQDDFLVSQSSNASPFTAQDIPDYERLLEQSIANLQQTATQPQGSALLNDSPAAQNNTASTPAEQQLAPQPIEEGLYLIPLPLITPDPYQPRQALNLEKPVHPYFLMRCLIDYAEAQDLPDEERPNQQIIRKMLEDIRKLAENIQQIGLLHPIIVRPIAQETSAPEPALADDFSPQYVIVVGERRYLAFAYLWVHGDDRYSLIPAIIQNVPEDIAIAKQWHENVFRRDLPFARIVMLCANTYRAVEEQTTLPEDLSETARHRALLDLTAKRISVLTGLDLSINTLRRYIGVAQRLDPNLYPALYNAHATADLVLALSRLPTQEQANAFKYYLEHGCLPARKPSHSAVAKLAQQLIATERKLSKNLRHIRAQTMTHEERTALIQALDNLMQAARATREMINTP